ncbi:Coenzyme F420 hydrogenase/dehydrogenase, beta subunit C-terminal domain [Parabacteroides pacaensis]|uniref:Coenzyme F420 hydrogenase/dehydrogenase, beta subunit C-terminal domain n=1 Tax=Parabacteroides pacaensis TaxID=2086575 RepID=UPI001F3C9B6F|nr:Coenzyme F420 hydrogenase/dehydrogenase, beta subunit C-terminal domain [Parabacteroides pacaensis]
MKLAKKEDCCGCTACLNICPIQCIHFREDNEGFLYPVVEESKCIDCGLCEKVCPFLSIEKKRIPQKVYAVKNDNKEILIKSSSGGIFTMLAEYIIAQKGIVFGVCFNEGWEAVHDYIQTKDQIYRFRGSKYVQSNLGSTYKSVESFLKEKKIVLFSGTPCQVLGLKRYLKQDYDNLFTVDFICHGVPSPKVWNLYLRELLHSLHTSLIEIKEIEFRNKFYGWKKFCFALTTKKKGKAFFLRMPLHLNAYLRGYLNDLYLRPSCYTCAVRCLKSRSDITLGDYWGIRNLYPSFYDDKGVSAVLLNTEKGVSYFNKLKCSFVESTYENVLKYNSSIEYSPQIPAKRKDFYDLFLEKGVTRTIKILTNMSLKERIKVRILQIQYKINKILKI